MKAELNQSSKIEVCADVKNYYKNLKKKKGYGQKPSWPSVSLFILTSSQVIYWNDSMRSINSMWDNSLN